jgi:hypothetical protein
MLLITLYAVIALVLVPLLFVASQWVNHDHLHLRRTRWTYALLAGLFWPVLLIGLAQFTALVAMRQAAGRNAGLAADSTLVTGPIGGIRPWTAAH